MGRKTVSTRVWYLEMAAPDQLRAPARPAPAEVEIAEVAQPTAAYVRFFYAAVGKDVAWTDRLDWNEARWQGHLEQPGVQMLTAAVGATPAGFALLVPGSDSGDTRDGAETEAQSETEAQTQTEAAAADSEAAEAPGRPGDVELEYFGLLPGWTGRGIGGALLYRASALAWQSGANRLWLHTCSLDSPAALPGYERRGFRVYRQHGREQVVLDRASAW